MVEVPYRIRVKKGDFEVEVQGDKDWVEKKFKELTAESSSIGKKMEIQNTDIPQTLGEFLDQKGNPQKHTDVVAVYAFWLFRVEKMNSFNVRDIILCYEKTRKTKPSNPNTIINQNVKTHLFADAPERKDGYKAWIITRTGEEYVKELK
jgi:hypothetical protein